MRRFLTILLVTAVCSLGAPTPAHASGGTWLWPVTGPVTRGFDPPDSPYGSGHRGIDIAVPTGTVVVAPASGTVTFAGPVGGYLFLTVDHGGGLASTYSWVSGLSVRKGAAVVAGQAIALTGNGHPGDTIPSLHFGVKLNGAYVDPMLYLESESVTSFIRLAPLLAGFTSA
jgi:murein DD-endopeptidase MepM/ murein hydrolase activator NlpD